MTQSSIFANIALNHFAPSRHGIYYTFFKNISIIHSLSHGGATGLIVSGSDYELYFGAWFLEFGQF
jgi:hypothetical protein